MPPQDHGRFRGRRRHQRTVGFMPPVTFYKPQGVPMFNLETVTIGHDELEAIRLVDHLGLEQAAAAERMGISRRVFAIDLKNGRRKIADALLNGKAIEIVGGDYVYKVGTEE